jgi:hypothetical protein
MSDDYLETAYSQIKILLNTKLQDGSGILREDVPIADILKMTTKFCNIKEFMTYAIAQTRFAYLQRKKADLLKPGKMRIDKLFSVMFADDAYHGNVFEFCPVGSGFPLQCDLPGALFGGKNPYPQSWNETDFHSQMYIELCLNLQRYLHQCPEGQSPLISSVVVDEAPESEDAASPEAAMIRHFMDVISGYNQRLSDGAPRADVQTFISTEIDRVLQSYHPAPDAAAAADAIVDPDADVKVATLTGFIGQVKQRLGLADALQTGVVADPVAAAGGGSGSARLGAQPSVKSTGDGQPANHAAATAAAGASPRN